jgi:hypothetical protein
MIALVFFIPLIICGVSVAYKEKESVRYITVMRHAGHGGSHIYNIYIETPHAPLLPIQQAG